VQGVEDTGRDLASMVETTEVLVVRHSSAMLLGMVYGIENRGRAICCRC